MLGSSTGNEKPRAQIIGLASFPSDSVEGGGVRKTDSQSIEARNPGNIATKPLNTSSEGWGGREKNRVGRP